MPAYKIAIPSHGRAATISTPRLIPKQVPLDIVVHDQSQAVWYRRNGLFPAESVRVTDLPPGIARQRNWILKHLVARGEWVLMMDDNIKHFEKVDPHFYNEDQIDREAFGSAFWRKVFQRKVPWSEVEPALQECMKKAESIGANLVGFATSDNPYFNHKKWSMCGAVVTKMALVRKTDLLFDETFTAKDDIEFSGANMMTFGKVLINHFMRPVAPHFQKGGIGNRAMRLEASKRDAARIVEKYPELFRINERRQPLGSEVICKVNSTQQIAELKALQRGKNKV